VKAASAAQLTAAAVAARSAAAADRPGEGVAAFLDTLTVVLRETLGRLEGTVDRVSEMVLTRSGPADRELIVTLQDFDRLQQELAALVDVISHCAATSGSWSGDSWTDQHGRKAVAAITVADLKHRFLRHLDGAISELASDGTDEVVF
jgi:hypothetical protein